MKNILLACIFFTCYSIKGQNINGLSSKTYSNSCRLDSSVIFELKFDQNTMNYYFQKTLRYFYTYDNNGNIINTLQLSIWNNDTTIWVKLNNFNNTYDSGNKLTDSLFQYWDSSVNQWKDNTRQHLAYDSNNNLLSTTEQEMYLGNWRDYSRTLNLYDLNNRQLSSISQLKDNLNNVWLSKDSTSFYYDINNKIASHSFYTSPYTLVPVWSQVGKDTIRYNLSNNPYYSLRRNWNSSSNTWDNYSQTTWNYYPNNIIESITTENWNTSANQWQIYTSNYYTYDSNNNVMHTVGPGGGPNGYFYSCSLVGIDEKFKNETLKISPNPTNSTLSITSTIDYSSIKIINSISQPVLIQENKQEPISVSDLLNGIYFIQLLDKKGNLLKTEKFIKE